MSDNLTVAAESPPEPRQRRRKQPADATPKKQPPYAVVVFNDNVHTFEYVIETFTKISLCRGKSCFTGTCRPWLWDGRVGSKPE